MDIKQTLMYILDAFQRINHYANCIYDSADEDVKDIIMAICSQEIKATQYDLDQVKLNELQGEDNENN